MRVQNEDPDAGHKQESGTALIYRWLNFETQGEFRHEEHEENGRVNRQTRNTQATELKSMRLGPLIPNSGNI